MEEPTRKILRQVMNEFASLSYIQPGDIPDIPLYMDQITTFMETKLDRCKRYPDDKILTKTMINNYTKNRLIPPPDKKKYSKEHLLLLIYVYYLKDFLQISDIKKILAPLEDGHFESEDNLSMTEIYQTVYEMLKGQKEYMTQDFMARWQTASDAFKSTNADSEDSEYLQLFAFVCELSFDVYVKKKLIETIADAMDDLSNGKK